MKILVMANMYPYNNMVFDEHLQVGDCAVKTRSYKTDYRGPILFYTSLKTERRVAEVYGYQDNSDNHRVIIGMADLVDVRELTTKEARQMVCNFNNITPRRLSRILSRDKNLTSVNGQDAPFCIYEYGYYIAPFRIGYFFKNMKRFMAPVPFKWPAGPVRPITIELSRYPTLHAEVVSAKLGLSS